MHVVPEQAVENDGEQAGEDETDIEPVANEAQNQNDIQRQHVRKTSFHSE